MSGEDNRARGLVRFAVFEVDFRTEELLKYGRRLPLPRQSFQILKILLENSGELITRERLRDALWPADTFVDFDHGVNAAVNRLREALGDSAEHPKFIETLPRRGYRFVWPIEVTNRPAVVDTPLPPAAANPSHHLAPRRTIWLALFVFLVIAITITLLRLNLLQPTLNRTSAKSDDSSSSSIKSIAVLPFKPLTSASSDEYLEMGLADTLINRLSGQRQIAVRSTHAVRRYQGRDFDPLVVGNEQKVDAVLEGNFQKLGQRVRVTARVLRVQDGSTLWVEKFEIALTDDFAAQDAIADKLADSLVPQLTGKGSGPTLAKRAPRNAQAHRSYLLARSTWDRRTDKTLKAALGHFQRAVALDPNYALAWSGLADCYSMLSDHAVLSPKEAYPRAREAAARALALDDSLAEAHTSIAWIKAAYEWDFAGAEAEFQRSLVLDPNYATGHQWYAEFLSAMGRHEEAVAEIKRAQELDPLSLIINAVVASIYYYARQDDLALEQCQRVIDLDPNFAETYFWRHRILEKKGMFGDAVAALERLERLKEWSTSQKNISDANHQQYWRKRLEDDLRARQNHWHFFVAESWAQLGDKDHAFAALEEVFQERSYWAIYVNVVPTLDPIRSDQRFAELTKRIGLPNANPTPSH